MKRLAAIVAAVGAFAIPATAFGAPDFGPGNSSKGPQDAGARCHPPGQTTDRPECN
jgi:hypothetical protein